MLLPRISSAKNLKKKKSKLFLMKIDSEDKQINHNKKKKITAMEPINKDLNSNRRITNEEVKDCSALIIAI